MPITMVALILCSLSLPSLIAFGVPDSLAIRDSVLRVYTSQDIVVTAHPAPVQYGQSPFLTCSINRPKTETLGSLTIGTALGFLPSVRVETNCQTCNYSQVRINGLSGAHVQFLVNSRPIVSPLLTLYGLDQFPLALLDRIEVFRGPASVLYGSSAIAGVVNLITRRQMDNTAAISSTTSLIGGRALENTTSAVLTMDHTADALVSLALTGVHRHRQGYDANSDGFTEIAQLRSTAVNLDASATLSSQSLLRLTVSTISEERRGGDALELPPDHAKQAEYRNHEILFTTATYEHRAGEYFYELFTGLTSIRRIHYTGVDHADGWGTTLSKMATGGARVSLPLRWVPSIVRLGFDVQMERTHDAVEAYGYYVDQFIRQAGIIVEFETPLITDYLTLTTGMRPSWHSVLQGVVLLGRAGVLWQPSEQWDLRASYAEGFRGPQAFEVDMHIAFASGGVSVITVDPALEKETARSVTLSALYRTGSDQSFYQLSGDVFATWLGGPFVLLDQGTNTNGTRRLLRTNGSNAQVVGLTVDLQTVWQRAIELSATTTIQSATYAVPVSWSEQAPATAEFLRTPRVYGSASMRWMLLEERLELTTTAILTGPMLQPYMGASGDKLVMTPAFLDLGLGVRWRITEPTSTVGSVRVALRCMNLLDAYQRDFDRGRYRDSNYIYGPAQPRTVSIGIQWSR